MIKEGCILLVRRRYEQQKSDIYIIQNSATNATFEILDIQTSCNCIQKNDCHALNMAREYPQRVKYPRSYRINC